MVLIDEIDLHLHPHWQQRILGDLQRTFPNTQFIVTTHSPQVLTTVHQENIRILENCQVYQSKISSYGAESVRMLEGVMNVPSRPAGLEKVNQLEHYLHLVNHGELKQADDFRQKEQLDKTFANDPALELADMILNSYRARRKQTL